MTSSRVAHSRSRRRRHTTGIRTVELVVVLFAGAAGLLIVVGKASHLPAQSGGAACVVSQVAADHAALAYFAGQGQSDHWPKSFDDLTAGTPPILALPTGVVAASLTSLTGHGWTLTMTGGGSAEPTFICG